MTTNALPIEFKNQIIRGDALELMCQLPDGCIDLVVTSPPYNLRKLAQLHWRWP